jgi:ribosome-binding protein aMBF1 (putative translation factor)
MTPPRRVTRPVFHKSIGAAIKTFREAVGLDQAGLAEKADVKAVVLEAIEQGEYTKLMLWDIERLAAPLGIRASQIVSLGETIADRPRS